jgi:lipopolysaccharide transport system permease protein
MGAHRQSAASSLGLIFAGPLSRTTPHFSTERLMQQISSVTEQSELQGLRPGAGTSMGGNVPAQPVLQPPAPEFDSRPITIIRPPSFSILAFARGVGRLVHYYDLLYTLSVHRLKVRYKQSVLGPSWAILQPTLLMLIYTVIFSRIVRVPTDGAPYALFAYSALLPWTFFSTAVSTATNSLVSHSTLVTKVYFPREILPLTYVIAALIDFLVASSMLGVLMAYYHVPLSVHALFAIPTIAVLMLFSIAVSLLLCAVQVRYRDIGVALPLLLQLWMFATPVVYPLSLVPARWQAWYSLNPMVGVVESFRRVTLQAAPPDFRALAMSGLVAVTLLLVAFIYFKHVEATVADII